jgi:hypothetical protein
MTIPRKAPTERVEKVKKATVQDFRENWKQKGGWIIPKNLPIYHSVQDMGGLISDLDEFSKICEQSLTVSESPEPSQTWLQKWKTDGWTQHLFGRTLKTSHTNSFTDLWISYQEEFHANHSRWLAKGKLRKVKSFYTHSFPTVWAYVNQKPSLSKMSQDCEMPYSILNYLKNTLKGTTQIQSFYISSKIWSVWDTQATIELKRRNHQAIFPMQGGVYLLGESETISTLMKFTKSLENLNSYLSSKFPMESQNSNGYGKSPEQWIAYLKQMKTTESNCLNDDDQLEIRTFASLGNVDNLINVYDVCRLMLKHAPLWNDASYFKGNMIPLIPKENTLAIKRDGVRRTLVRTLLGDTIVHSNIVKDNFLNRGSRASLLGNGVVPQQCSVAVLGLFKSILDGSFRRDYLPNPTWITQNKKKISNVSIDSIDDLYALFETNIETNVNLERVERIRMDLGDRLATEKWPTPKRRDENDVSIRRGTANRIPFFDEETQTEKALRDRSKGSPAEAMFHCYYEAKNMSPIDIERNIFEQLDMNLNQNWVETIMGLDVGWTQANFGVLT